MNCIVWWIWLLEIRSTFDALHLWVRCSYMFILFCVLWLMPICFSVEHSTGSPWNGWHPAGGPLMSPSDSVPRCAKMCQDVPRIRSSKTSTKIRMPWRPCAFAALSHQELWPNWLAEGPSWCPHGALIPSMTKTSKTYDQSASIDYTYYTSWDLIWLVQVWAISKQDTGLVEIVPHILYSTHSCGL